MKLERSRSKEQIFAEMHRELRAWNPEVPESPERLDPILRILLQLYSHQLSEIERRIDVVWDVASSSLIKALFPESKRWPVPAFTVMRCELSDPVTDIDPDTRFIYREKREGGQTFFFSPHRSEKLLSVDVKHILIKRGNSLTDIRLPSAKHTQPSRQSHPAHPTEKPDAIFVALDFDGSPSDFEGALLFLMSTPETLKQLRWSYWCPGTATGNLIEDNRFCPGLTTSINDIFHTEKDSLPDWGGLRTSENLFGTLENNFVILPDRFVSGWQKSQPDEKFADLAFGSGIEISPSDSGYYWIRIDLPEGGDKFGLDSPIGIYTDCFVAINKNDLTLFKHTGSNRLVEIEIPEDLSNILEITSVVDSDGRQYFPSHEAQRDRSHRSYSIEECNDKAVLWFDFSSMVEFPPDSITVNYSVTAGVDANGIEAGKIEELYESHPGITSCANLIPTSGAVPAKTTEQIIMEATARLRSRDRALSFQEISKWAMTFDPRIVSAECENSTERTVRGVRRCIAVTIKVRSDDIRSDDETTLLRTRLTDFLKSRSPVNTQFKVKIIPA